MPDPIETLRTDDVTTIYINRVERGNAFDPFLLQQLKTTLLEQQYDEALIAVVLRSKSPRVFSSGADLDVLAGFADVREARNYALLLEETMAAALELRQPLFAIVNGPAIGAGLALALNADFRLFYDIATARFPATRIGAILPVACSLRLQHIIGRNMSSKMLLTGIELSASECRQCGLATDVGPESEMESRLNAYLQLLRRQEREAVQMQKRVLNQSLVSEITQYAGQSSDNFAYFQARGYWKNLTKAKSAKR
jgi:enoyl-CoA hydratase/carnithine racemase